MSEIVRRSTADLDILLTPVPYGPRPSAGVPSYSTTFGRDGLIAAMQSLWLDPRIALAVLKRLAAYQATDFDPESDAEPGKILHEMRAGEMAALHEIPFGLYYGSVDSTPLFVLLAGRYAQTTGRVEARRPVVCRRRTKEGNERADLAIGLREQLGSSQQPIARSFTG